jgi:hypothetical protein
VLFDDVHQSRPPPWTTGYVVDYGYVRRGETTTSSDARGATGSGQTAEYLLRFLGYALLGRNVVQRLTFIVGPKRTGKSKALEISARVLGPDYAIISQPKPITRSKFGTHHDSETWSIRASGSWRSLRPTPEWTSTRPWSRTSRLSATCSRFELSYVVPRTVEL